jgi:glycosyltransferase involved in cell wall biosynthesis
MKLAARGAGAGTDRAEIVLFLSDLSGGGAERVMVALANGFATRGRSVDLVLARARGPYLDEIAPQVQVFDLEAGSSIRALPALIEYLRARRPSALLTTLHHTGIVALMAKWLAGSSVRVYLREANTLSAVRPRTFRGRMLIVAARHSYLLADGVVAVSDGVADDLRHQLPGRARRLITIYNPVVGSDLQNKSRCSAGHPWLTDSRYRVVLAAGRLTAQKDFSTLVRAFGMLCDPDLRLVILGEGEERGQLQSLIDSLHLTERVDMPGYVNNPFAYMARASLFVLSSRWEGMPSVLIQAMACGCPVVSTDCPSGPAEVLSEGELGELVAVGDATALAKAMERQLGASIDRRLLIERASEFSVEASVDAYLELLQQDKPRERRGSE